MNNTFHKLAQNHLAPLDAPRVIGGNRFYRFRSDAEYCGASSGSVLIHTTEGYCVLGPHEGCTYESIDLIRGGTRLAEKRGGGWQNLEA